MPADRRPRTKTTTTSYVYNQQGRVKTMVVTEEYEEYANEVAVIAPEVPDPQPVVVAPPTPGTPVVKRRVTPTLVKPLVHSEDEEDDVVEVKDDFIVDDPIDDLDAELLAVEMDAYRLRMKKQSRDNRRALELK